MSVSALHYDDRVINHEIAHTLVAHAERFEIVAVLADRRSSFLDGHGLVSAVPPPDAPPEALCRFVIAGNVEGSVYSKADERRVLELWAQLGSPRGWIEAREREVDAILRRQARAFTALAHLAAERGGNLAGSYLAVPLLTQTWMPD